MSSKKPKRGGSLADQLKAAGLLDEKKAHAIEREKRHNKRKEQKQAGPSELERRKASFLDARQQQSKRDRELSAGQNEQLNRDRWLEIVRAHGSANDGSRRFFFVDASGRIPFLLVSDTTMRALQDGDAAIVTCHGALKHEPFAVIKPRVAVDEARRLDADSVLFWNHSPSH